MTVQRCERSLCNTDTKISKRRKVEDHLSGTKTDLYSRSMNFKGDPWDYFLSKDINTGLQINLRLIKPLRCCYRCSRTVDYFYRLPMLVMAVIWGLFIEYQV